MNVIDQAMQMERDGEIFYREMADKATDPGFREIFTQLANDEIKHYQLFSSIHSRPTEFFATTILKDAGGVFTQMIAESRLDNLDSSQLDLYLKAMETEAKSKEYYLQQAAATSDPAEQNLFIQIADEEAKHYFLLHNIYELVLRPQVWVENGEFVHLEDY